MQGQWCTPSTGCISTAAGQGGAGGAPGGAPGQTHNFNMVVDNIECAALLADATAVAHVKEAAIKGVMEDLQVPREAVGVRLYCGSLIIETWVNTNNTNTAANLQNAQANGFPGVLAAIQSDPALAAFITGPLSITSGQAGGQAGSGTNNGISGTGGNAAKCNPSPCTGILISKVPLPAQCNETCSQTDCCDMGPMESMPGSIAEAMLSGQQSLGTLVGLWQRTRTSPVDRRATIPTALFCILIGIVSFFMFGVITRRHQWTAEFSRLEATATKPEPCE